MSTVSASVIVREGIKMIVTDAGIEGAKRMRCKDPHCNMCEPIMALIARLEAAECYLEAHPCQDSACLTYLNWQKMAGK